MDEILAATMRDAVYGRLDYLDRLVTDADEPSRAALADTEISRLTRAWRDLLTAHQPDEHGRCPQCSGWRRPRQHPCSVWTTAHQHLIVADGPPAAASGRHAAAAGRPTVAVRGGLLTLGRAAPPDLGTSRVHRPAPAVNREQPLERVTR